MCKLGSEELYPLKFVVLAKEKVWGGFKLAQMLEQGVPAEHPVGEVWLVWDRLAVEHGPLAGRLLGDLAREFPRSILGTRLTRGLVPGFPLLIKLIDARETLSVQVHPDDGYAQQREGEPFGKSEMWVILDAEPGAQLIHGVKHALARSGVEKAIGAGTLQEKMAYVEVAAGDVILNTPGTIHAIGKGILLYELQQSSDLTYRFYDWNRNDPNRPLHIEKSLDVADLEPLERHKIRPVEVGEAGASRTFLGACRHFAAEMLRVQSRTVERPSGLCFHALTVLQGSGSLRYSTDQGAEAPLHSGASVLVPAGIEEYEVHATEDPLVVIKGYVPDLLQDVVAPLREQGVPDETILQLGGDARHSDLAHYILRAT